MSKRSHRSGGSSRHPCQIMHPRVDDSAPKQPLRSRSPPGCAMVLITPLKATKGTTRSHLEGEEKDTRSLQYNNSFGCVV
jgi:hypothetical protein